VNAPASDRLEVVSIATDPRQRGEGEIVSSYLLHRGMFIAVLSTTIATTSCGGGGGGGTSSGATSGTPAPPAVAPVVVTRPISQTDLEVAQAIYTGAPRTPENFYVDAAPSGHDNVATAHLKNNDIASGSVADPVHELCTDDWNEALGWSELRAQNSPHYADLVATNEEPRYFEFGRSRAGEPQFYVRDRVFKCSYLDRASANLRDREGAAGQMNRRPVTAAELRTLSEYLWAFTSYNNFGYAVLNSSGTSTASTLTHRLHIAALVRNGSSSTCDRIDILAWRHTLDISTGALMLDVETEFSFGAKESGGSIELCGT
jgi:hypothetical protein